MVADPDAGFAQKRRSGIPPLGTIFTTSFTNLGLSKRSLAASQPVAA